MDTPKQPDPNETKTMAEWEKELNMMFFEYVPNKKLTRKEAMEHIDLIRGTGVIIEERKEWLKNNGYEVTRENMLNADLPSRPADEQ